MGLWSVLHTLSLLLLPPQGEGSSHCSSSPAWGPSHRRQSSMNFSSLSPSHGLQFFTNCSSWEPLMRFSPSGTDCVVCVPHRVTSPASKPAPAQAALHGTTGPARSLVKHKGHSPLWAHRPAPAWVPCGLHVDICSIMGVHGCRGY